MQGFVAALKQMHGLKRRGQDTHKTSIYVGRSKEGINHSEGGMKDTERKTKENTD